MSQPNWFLAVPLPPQAHWQEAAATAPAALRRFAAEDLHITVVFLGSCGEQRALAAWQAVVSLEAASLSVQAGGWRALGPPRQPSAYGLTLAAGHQELSDLLHRCQPPALAAAGRALPVGPPLPHVTLLRPHRRQAEQWITPMRAWMHAAPLPPATAQLQELALWTWAPDRRERLFQIVRRRPLQLAA